MNSRRRLGWMNFLGLKRPTHIFMTCFTIIFSIKNKITGLSYINSPSKSPGTIVILAISSLNFWEILSKTSFRIRSKRSCCRWTSKRRGSSSSLSLDSKNSNRFWLWKNSWQKSRLFKSYSTIFCPWIAAFLLHLVHNREFSSFSFFAKAEEILKLAVKRMLPKNALATHMLDKLKLFVGPDHTHQAQQPQPFPQYLMPK